MVTVGITLEVPHRREDTGRSHAGQDRGNALILLHRGQIALSKGETSSHRFIQEYPDHPTVEDEGTLLHHGHDLLGRSLVQEL